MSRSRPETFDVCFSDTSDAASDSSFVLEDSPPAVRRRVQFAPEPKVRAQASRAPVSGRSRSTRSAVPIAPIPPGAKRPPALHATHVPRDVFEAEFNPVGSRSRTAAVTDEEVFEDVEDDLGPGVVDSLRPPPAALETQFPSSSLSGSTRSVRYRVDSHKSYHERVAGTSARTDALASAQPAVASPLPRKAIGIRIIKFLRQSFVGKRLRTVDSMLLRFATVATLVVSLCGFGTLCYGISAAIMPNAREVRAAQFNAAVRAFNDGELSQTGSVLVNQLTARVSVGAVYSPAASEMSRASEAVFPIGNSEGIVEGTSTFLEVSLPIVAATRTNRNSFFTTIQVSRDGHPDLQFSLSALNGVSADDEPPLSSIMEVSPNGLGGLYYLHELCAVIELDSNGELGVSTDEASCYYPFGSWQRYSPLYSGRVIVRVRVRGDPFLALQRETHGSRRFAGKTRYTQNMEAGSTIFLGLVFFAGSLALAIHGVAELLARRSRLMAARKESTWHREGSRRGVSSTRGRQAPEPPVPRVASQR